MDKEHLSEKLNKKSDDLLMQEIKNISFGQPNKGRFYASHCKIKLNDLRNFIEGQKNEGQPDGRQIRCDLLIDLIIKSFFEKYQEDHREEHIGKFLNKIEEMDSKLNELLDFSQQQ